MSTLKAADIFTMGTTKTCGQQQVQRPPEHVGGTIAEHHFSAGIKQHNVLLRVDRHDGIHRRIDDPGKAQPAFTQCIGEPVAFNGMMDGSAQ
jgi:hypothetical protein